MKVTLAQYSKAVGLVHEAGAAPEKWREALAAVMAMLAGSRISLMDIEAGSDRLLGLEQIGHDPAHVKAYSEHYFAVDPTIATALSGRPHRSMAVYDHFEKSTRARHEYFDFARACDIGDAVGVTTAEECGRRALLSLQRPLDAEPYQPEDKSLLELLAPHVQLAKRIQGKLGEAWAAGTELEAAFSLLATAAFILDRDGRIRHLNGAASAMLGRKFPLASRHGRLALADPKLATAFQNALRDAARESGRSSALLVRLAPAAAAEVLVAPLQPPHARTSSWREPLALVVVATGERDKRSIASRMQKLYRLTPAESRVAAALATGQTLEDISCKSGVTEATLRSQLRSIFGKTGTSRQAELVRLALAGTAFVWDR